MIKNEETTTTTLREGTRNSSGSLTDIKWCDASTYRGRDSAPTRYTTVDDTGEGAEDGPYRDPNIPLPVLSLLVTCALVQSFSSGIITLLINGEMQYEPAEVQRYWMYISLTGWVQPVLGWLSDALVLWGEKRRPLFLLCCAGNTLIYSAYFFFPHTLDTFSVFMPLSLLSQIFLMGTYIPLNGLLVEVGRHDAENEAESIARMGSIMSTAMFWRSSGALAGMVLQLFLVLLFNTRQLLVVTGILFGLLIPLMLTNPHALFLRPSAEGEDNFFKKLSSCATQLKNSCQGCSLHSDGMQFVVVLLFIFAYMAMPDGSTIYYNYLFRAFQFQQGFYAFLSVAGYLGSMVGAYVFSLWMTRRARQEAAGMRRTSIRFIFSIGSLAWAFGYGTNILLCSGFVTRVLHIPAYLYIPIDSFFMSAFVRFAFMPSITMAAEHAPRNFEATTFEVFSVVTMMGGTLSAFFTAALSEGLGITTSDFSLLWLLLLISVVCKLIPIPLAYLLPQRQETAVEVTVSGTETPPQ
ncbi:folate/biopterin transporter [Angomonas deanei]|nr:folate/biopterin transporter [Angomonas deanei]|eukprot:EPY30280.1 folate/biopterin transporter [Angomonas deanei]